MGLFDIFDGDDKNTGEGKKGSIGNFSVRKTDNIPRLLKGIAKQSGHEVKDLDFDLIRVTTEITEGEQGERSEIDEQVALKLKDEGRLEDPDLGFYQIYEVNVFPKKASKELQLDIQMAVNKSYSRAKATIKKSSTITYKPTLETSLIKEINKRKLRSGMLIDLYDEAMREGIKNIVTKVRVNDRLDEDYSLELCRWLEPKPTVNDAITIHGQKKAKDDTEAKNVDYRERGFVTTIDEGEVAVDYRKPRKGTPGRNFKGVFIPAPEPKVNHEPKFEVDTATIEVKDTLEQILYIAKKKGYVKLDDKELRIADELEIDEANFRATGNINAEQDKDIKISLKGKGKEEDNIGANTKVEASEITVSGSVANKAEVRAKKIKVEGQTHKSSKLYADDIAVGIHRGYAEGKRVKIRQLENGTVVADEAVITQVVGGTIRAKRVEIGVLFSNARIIASRSITIKSQLKGSDNQLTIEPAATVKEQETLNGYLTEVKELETKIEGLQKAFNEKKSQINQARESSAAIKEKIMKAKKEGRRPNQSDIDRYKRFTQTMEEVKDMQDNLEVLHDKLGSKKDEITIIQDGALHAEIVNMSGWHTHNKVYYRLIDPPQLIEYVPKIGTGASRLTLKMVGEEEFDVTVEDL